MRNPIAFVSLALALACDCPAGYGQTVKYEFTGGSMLWEVIHARSVITVNGDTEGWIPAVPFMTWWDSVFLRADQAEKMKMFHGWFPSP
jgi:hypothetical protein